MDSRIFLCVLFALIAPLRAFAEPSATTAPDAKPCGDSEFKPIRGYCSDNYLRIDVLWEATHEPWKAAFKRYFSLITEDNWPDAQIRHTEDPSKSRRWRGEFMIEIARAKGGLDARYWRAKEPLKVQLHHLVHERLYPKIADEFAKSTLTPDSPEWAAAVRAMVPPTDQLVSEIEVERFSTSSEACAALSRQMTKSTKLALPPPPPAITVHADGTETIVITIHGESYDVVLAQYPRLVHVRDADDRNPYFAWADETVGALEQCWRPAIAP